MERLIYDIWLSLAVTPDTETFARLLGEFKDSESIYNADEARILALTDARSSDRQRLLSKDLTRAREVFEFCQSRGVGIVTYFDEKFPERLKSIPTPPVLLYYRGRLPDFDKCFCTAVVGTRRLSGYGRKNAYSVSYDLAKAGAVVVSGMATGIDGVALAGALAAGGTTVAVLGSGIDVCYPKQHKPLAREIVKNGCVFTEYAPGTRPEQFNFPRRNRIISGLCEASLIIEGVERSGAIHTARHAANQGRPVYALPGNVDNKNSQVCNLLLKNGAKAFTCADDIIRDFCDKHPGIINPFALTLDARVKMEDALRKYQVSAVAPEDDIFTAKPKRKAREDKAPASDARVTNQRRAHQTPATPEAVTEQGGEERSPVGFDERTLKIYKRIPMTGSCLIESLVDSEFTLRDVMKALLKLEMGRFVKMLPGERIARNL